MQFCPECGSVIIGTDCARCNFKSESAVKLESSEKVEIAKEIAVVTEGENEINPKVAIECLKCKHDEAFFWTRQTRSSDEAETKFHFSIFTFLFIKS